MIGNKDKIVVVDKNNLFKDNTLCYLNNKEPIIIRSHYSKFSQPDTLSFLICKTPYRIARPTNPSSDC